MRPGVSTGNPRGNQMVTSGIWKKIQIDFPEKRAPTKIKFITSLPNFEMVKRVLNQDEKES